MMRATVSVKALKDALNKVSLAVERHSNIQILSMFKFEVSGDRLTISGTDLDIEISASVPALGVEPGSICVPRAIWRLVNALPNWETIAIREADDRRLVVDMPDGRVSMIGVDPKDYPGIDLAGKTFGRWALPAIELLDAFARVSPFISYEETRYYLNGIFVHSVGERMGFAATDGHKLGSLIIEAPNADPVSGMIVPRLTIARVLKTLPRDGEVLVRFTNPHTHVAFEAKDGSFTITSRLIDGTFPDFKRVIPTDPLEIFEINRQSWLQKFARIDAVSRDYRATTVFADSAKMSASMRDHEFGEMVIALAGRRAKGGGTMSFGCNAAFMIDCLRAHRSEDVELGFKSPGDPIRLADKTGMLTVLMPLREAISAIPLPDGAAP